MIEYAFQQERILFKLTEKEREKRRIEEESCYNPELDLWNSTKLAELNEEEAMKRMMERMKL